MKKAQARDQRVFNAIKSATVSMACCVLSDIFAMVLSTMVLGRNAPLTLSRTVYDVSLFVNVVAVLFCFDNTKKIVVGPCSGKHAAKHDKVANQRRPSTVRSTNKSSSFV